MKRALLSWLPSLGSPLRHRGYRRLFIAQAIALLGTGLSTVALALLAYELAGDQAGRVLGTALALKMIAYVAIAPLAGGYAQRLPRKSLLIVLDAARALIVLTLPFVEALWQIYLAIFALNACSAVFTPVFQAAIPDLLADEDDYTKALSLSRLAYDLENLLSPTLAALLLSVASFHVLFAVNSVAFISSALLVSSISLPAAAAPERQRGVIQSAAFGIRAYWATPRLRGLLLLSLAVAAASAMLIVNTVIYVRSVLGGNELQTAVAVAAAGAGSMLAAVSLPRLLDRLTEERPVMLAGGVILSAGLAAGLATPGFDGLLAVWFVLGFGSSLIQTPAGRLLRRSCLPADRSAFFSAQFALSHACWLLTYPLAGWLGAVAGLPATFALLAGLTALATLLAARLWPAHDPAVLFHTHEALSHSHQHVHDTHHRHRHEGWEGPEPHSHPHRHTPLEHAHRFVIDHHHPRWPSEQG